jgi:hypothetical protein
MKKKYLFMLLSTLMVLSLVGCGNNNQEPQPTESAESTEDINNESTEDTESTENENLIECVVVVDSIDENGILCYPYEDTSELWDIDKSFYISSKDISIYKNDKTSIYDIIYFYDGFTITYDGTYETKSEYSIIKPKEGTKIKINLTEEYKNLNIENNDNRDETPIDIVDKNENKADVEFSGMFCKFKYSAKYKDNTTINDGENFDIMFTDLIYTYNDNGTNLSVKLFTINKINKSYGNSRFGKEINYETGFIIDETNNYIYELSVNTSIELYDVKKELIDCVVETITIIE